MAQIVTTIQSHRFAAENGDIARVLAPTIRMRAILSVAFIVLCMGTWALYDVVARANAQGLVAGLALLAIFAFTGSSIPLWNQIQSMLTKNKEQLHKFRRARAAHNR